MKFSHLLLSIVAILGIYTIVAGEPAMTETVSVASVGAYAFGDALLRRTKALPGSATSVTSDAIDIGTGANVEKYEIEIMAPVLTTAQLPDSQTMTYALVTSANDDLSSPTIVNASVLVQTGAGGAGAAASEVRLRLPIECDRYIGVKATKSGAGSAAGASVVIALKF